MGLPGVAEATIYQSQDTAHDQHDGCHLDCVHFRSFLQAPALDDTNHDRHDCDDQENMNETAQGAIVANSKPAPVGYFLNLTGTLFACDASARPYFTQLRYSGEVGPGRRSDFDELADECEIRRADRYREGAIALALK